MKHNLRKTLGLWLLAALLAVPFSAPADGGASLRLLLDKQERLGASDSCVVYPAFAARDPALSPTAEKINAAIQETAHIDQYLQLLPAIGEGGTGLRLTYQEVCGAGFLQGEGYYSLLMQAEGKMLQGPPSQAYYPLVLSADGEKVSFDQVFSDPEGAKAFIEQYLTECVEPALSTYLENSQLFPVPFDNFAFSGNGHITFYYPHDQLSFLSGASGAVSFRYSELWDYLDTSENSVALNLCQSGLALSQYGRAEDLTAYRETLSACFQLGNLLGLITLPGLGAELEQLEEKHAISTDSGFYPGGAYLEAETPELLGSWVLTDESETLMTGLLTSRVDLFGIETGKTSLNDAIALLGEPLARLPLDQNTASAYLVCPGMAAVYTYEGANIALGNTGAFRHAVSLTLYADENGTVQFVKLALENE